MTSTHTHTHTVVRFANPYIRCNQCGRRVEGYIVAPEHEVDWANYPCEHFADHASICLSWSPADGCNCLEHLGKVDHPMEVENGG